MPKKKDSASKHIERLIGRPKFGVGPPRPKFAVLRSNITGRLDWNACPPEVRAREANRATTLALPAAEILKGERLADALIRKAFREWQYDPQNPWNWRLLLIQFAEAYFGEKPQGGRPIEWTAARLQQLADDYNHEEEALWQSGGRRPSQAKVVVQLVEKNPSEYPSVETVQVHIRKVRHLLNAGSRKKPGVRIRT
jgi:hypothetical protein